MVFYHIFCRIAMVIYDCLSIYTSPPPSAEPLLEEKPCMGRLCCRTHFSKTLDKSEIIDYNKYIKKGKTSNGYAGKTKFILTNNRLCRGGYSAFMEKIINKTIISKTAKSNFLTTTTMLTFHKHTPPFIDLVQVPVCKGGHNRR